MIQSLSPMPLILHDMFDGIAHVRLNRPQSRNCLSLDMLAALQRTLEAIAGDTTIRVVILGAEGPVFCAGHDLRELHAHRCDPDKGAAFFRATMAHCSTLMQAIIALPQPVIAAIEGLATAAGCQLVASCDLAIGGADASFCTPGVDIGLFCSTPMVALSRNVARKHAMAMLLTGRRIDAAQAERMGLINQIAPAGETRAAAFALATMIAAKPRHIIAIGKRAFYAQIELPLRQAYDLASETMAQNMLHRDAVEGIGAFLDKRPANWTAADQPSAKAGQK